MAKHRIFNADRYLDKFQGFENLLRDYCRLWPRKLGLNVAKLDIETFKKWLIEGESEVKDELMEGLYRCYDLSTEHGHEDLFGASADSDYNPDQKQELPVECLALTVRTEREDVFNLAYDRYALFHAERFSIYQGLKPQQITRVNKRQKSFEKLLAEEFRNFKNSDRVLVRNYREGDYTHFIVYHEKRVKATLIFKGTKTRPKVAPSIYRPAQQDFISYNEVTGQVEIEAGYENEEKRLRQVFAQCFFDDKEFFDGDQASERFALGEIADPTFRLDTSDGVTAVIVHLRFKLAQEGGPTFDVRSKDVLKTLEFNGLRRKLKADMIQMVAIKFGWQDDKRGKRVELSGSNKIKFNRATHAEEIFQLLKDWEIMLSDEAEEANAEDNSEFGDGEPSRNVLSIVSTARNQTLPENPASKTLRSKNPR